jgi:general secretion pathway protein F
MGIFRYQALTEQGKRVTGMIDADSMMVAKERLRHGQVLVTYIESLADQRKEVVLSPSSKLALTRELAQLLRAGLPLYESLQTIEEKHRKHRCHALYLDLCDQLKLGYPFSKVLERYPKTFDAVYIAMIKAAEQTGSLPSIFEQLSLLIGRQQKLKKQLLSAMIYPGFLGAFCFLILCVLLFFVVPSMKDLFEGRALHPLTASVLALSQFVNDYLGSIVVTLVFLGTALVYFLRRKAEAIVLHLPLIKTVVLQAALARFSRCLGILLSGGIPLLQALGLSRKVIHNSLIEKVVTEAEEKVVEGKLLSSELAQSSLIPPLVVRMIKIAEETGKLSLMLTNVAEIYEDELEKNLAQIVALLQPMLLLVLGLIVGVVLLSILIPLTDVGSFINP